MPLNMCRVFSPFLPPRLLARAGGRPRGWLVLEEPQSGVPLGMHKVFFSPTPDRDFGLYPCSSGERTWLLAARVFMCWLFIKAWLLGF